ncbi:MAG: TatD family hydrolase [Candidatus Omnitrophica bacterium]|nr:TatD family hydrolase [Candidatus Omnitrophota bacterium]MCM8826050.1 TatD family hydrolase [Candidatus Omnitrophota bacterium]
MLIDTHCHINSLDNSTRNYLFERVNKNYLFIDISIDYKSALSSYSLSQKFPFIYTSLGFHPLTEEPFSLSILDNYKDLIVKSKKVIAIGEVGLDYKANISLDYQINILRNFILLAREHSLPLIIHNRVDDYKILDILDDYYSDYESIIFHCFSQDKEFLEKVVNKKGAGSFSLNVLRRKKKLDEALINVPCDNLLLETDSPYMKIDNHYSNPLDIEKVYSYTAEVKNISIEDLRNIIFNNVKRIFNIDI